MPYADNNGVKIRYEIEGKGPPLMLQHGFGANLEDWYDNGYVAALKGDFRLILVDGRGHGKSDKPRRVEDYHDAVMASDYVKILDDLAIRKVNYWGYSMGANIGFRCVARHALPRINSFIMGGGSPYGYQTQAEKDFGAGITNAMAEAAEKGIEAWVAYLEKQGTVMTPELKARAMANDPKALLAHRRGSIDVWPSAADILPKINVPCLIYVGEADAYLGKNREAASVIPGARFISFPGFTHMQGYQRCEAILPHARKFLAEVLKK